jgi:hypothetical protein
MRRVLCALLGLVVIACGARTLLDTHPDGGVISSMDAGATGDAAVDGSGQDGGPLTQAPVPSCTGMNSQCIQSDAGKWVGASVITCDGVYFVGPWTLLLERKIYNTFQVIQTQVVMEPGFGAKFLDTTGPPAQLSYRVCVVDDMGTRCDTPFTTYGPVQCACEPSTCASLQACDTVIDDGCNDKVPCGGCQGGAVCNPANHSCCPPGMESDGTFGCECAPSKPCPGATYWDPSICSCALPNVVLTPPLGAPPARLPAGQP